MGCGASRDTDVDIAKLQQGADVSLGRKSAVSAKQKHWIDTKWLPFATELKKELRKVEAKAKAGVAPAERLPSQDHFMEWGHRCIALTEEIRGRGRGSLSLLYQALQRMGQHDGVAPYQFNMVPTEWSDDGYVRVLDAVTRAAFYGGNSNSNTANPKADYSSPKDVGGDCRMHDSGKAADKGPRKGSKRKMRKGIKRGGGATTGDSLTAERTTKHKSVRAVDETGALKQSVQESAIANTEITGIMTHRDARLLVIGGVMKHHMLKLVRIRQYRALVAIEKATKSRGKRELVQRLIAASTDDDECAEDKDAAECIAMLKDIKAAVAVHYHDGDDAHARRRAGRKKEQQDNRRREDASRLAHAVVKLNFVPGTPSWDALEKHGMIASSFGQLTVEGKVRLAKNVESLVDDTWGEDELSTEVLEFIDFVRNNPGGVYMDDIHLHRRMLCAVQMSSGVAVVSKARITSDTAHRFLSVRWVRTVPLMRGEESGPPTEVREASTVEETRVRCNAFSYDNQHGLGLCGSTHRSRDELDLRACRPVKLLPREMHDELGELIVNDPGAKIGNWYCNDFDKALNEFVLLNAQPVDHGEIFTSSMCPLPGEAPVMVGQNPRVASSIGKTQHTQMATGDARWWPILRLRPPDYDSSTPPLELQLGPDAYVELVQIGDDPDSVSLRVETLEIGAAVDPAVIKLVHGARMVLLKAFGGRRVDFNFYAAANCALSGAVILLTPMAMIQANSDKTLWFNDDTGLSDKGCKLPCHSIDFSQGKGNIHVFGKEAWDQGLEGRSMMGRLYDFCRKVGCRKVLEEYLRESVRGWEAPHVGLAKEVRPPGLDISCPPTELDGFWDA